MYFCVFSYNRGQYLANCVRSIETNARSAKIYVFDDGSDDPSTNDVLDAIRQKHDVICPKTTEGSTFLNGGLGQNMQAAIATLPAGAQICFVQDDMQMVRRLDGQDLADIDTYFESDTNAAFLHPAFMKGGNRRRDQKISQWSEASGCYHRIGSTQSAGVCFSDVSIARIDRLRAVAWEFEHREKSNEARARKHFGKMGFMRNPFLMWLPNVPAYRGKTRTLALRIGEKWRNSGYYPFVTMSEDERAEFIARGASVLPVAEDFLRLQHGQLPEPWVYYPLERINPLRHLNRLELKARRVMRRLRAD